MQIKLQPEFDDILQPLGTDAAKFFLAASLYHAKKSALRVLLTWQVWILTAL